MEHLGNMNAGGMPISTKVTRFSLVFNNKGLIYIQIKVIETAFYENAENNSPIYQKRAEPLVFGESRLKVLFHAPLEVFSPHMHVTLAHVGARPQAKDAFQSLTATYLERCSAFAQSQAESFRTEQALLDWLAKQQGRTAATTVLLDSRGRQMTSEALAAWVGGRRDQGAQHIVFAVGPASGWSDAARARAQLLLSLSPLTLAHSLARLVIAEQIYRAFTILSGHPYHTGH
jgi:23S rRNA (pseudouridine1915-N3)-methyltransferase